MKSKGKLKFREKIVYGVFMESLPSFKRIWQERAPEEAFDEFLAEICTEQPQNVKKKEKILFGAFKGVIPKIIGIWRESGSEKPFEEWLDEIAARHERITKKSKKEVTQ